MGLRRAFTGTGAASAFTIGTALALATFTFQTTQAWVDEAGPDRAFRWLIPSTLAVLVATLIALTFLSYFLTRKAPTAAESEPDPYHQYADGVIA